MLVKAILVVLLVLFVGVVLRIDAGYKSVTNTNNKFVINPQNNKENNVFKDGIGV